MSNPKILVVEDEGIVAIDIQICLESLGYTVTAIADTGELAIKKAKETYPDLVLMDIRLKGKMDGIEAARKITEDLDIPIIYLTAYADRTTLERAKITGPFGYILKPFEERELHTAIEIAFYKYQMEKQLKQNVEWLSTLLKSIGDAVIANDRRGYITFMNPVAEQLTGWKQEESVGKDATEIFQIINEKTRDRIESPILKVLNEGKKLTLPKETLLVAKDGREIPIDDSAAPITDEKGNITGVVLVFRDIIERKLVEKKLLHQAFYDGLTDLPNRNLFIEKLKEASERANQNRDYLFAVLFLDIDRFKVVNDSLGHPIGDMLLMAVASRLKNCLTTNYTIARMGSDEFAILLENIPDISSACAVAELIIAQLNSPFQLENYSVVTGISIGVVVNSINYSRAEDLIRDADIAMQQAKTLGKGRYEVFDTAMYDRVIALLELEQDLRKAIERKEFLLYYQPIVSLQTQEIIGFEALVRWQHPERGLLSPAEFIPVAQETGLLVLIDWWVLREACHQLRIWQDRFPHTLTLKVSVNLSSKQLSQVNLVEKIEKIRQETGLDTSSLNLEITESAIIENPESAAAILSQIRALGIKVHIDDFGTGYSSLSYLHRFPIDTMKIDRSFINRIDKDRESLEIVRTIVTLAHNLGMDAIAEGIETEAQLNILQELQCEFGQGYFFSKPLDRENATSIATQQ